MVMLGSIHPITKIPKQAIACKTNAGSPSSNDANTSHKKYPVEKCILFMV